MLYTHTDQRLTHKQLCVLHPYFLSVLEKKSMTNLNNYIICSLVK